MSQVHLQSGITLKVQGTGKPLILLHGLAGSMACWKRNVPVLSRHRTVYLVDLPGFGSMRKYADQFSLAQSAQWLRDLLTALNLEGVDLVGHSMGGLITAMFAAQWPECVSKIVLAAPAIGLPGKSVRASLLPVAKGSFALDFSFIPTMLWDSVRAGPATLLRAARELLSINIQRELGQIKCPCLLVWGENDPLVPPSLSVGLQSKIDGSDLCILPGAGHVVMYDQAEKFNQAVLDFLGSA